jgi:hypothetical protein
LQQFSFDADHSIALLHVGLLKQPDLTGLLPSKNHHLVTGLGDHCFQVALVDFDGSCAQMHLGYVWFDYLGNFYLLIVKNRIDVVGFDSDCYSCPDPLEIVLLFLLVLILLLQLLINLLNFV